MEKDIIVADIIREGLGLLESDARVVVYGQNYNAPKDSGIYVVVSVVKETVVSATNKYDEETSTEISSVSSFIDMQIEITSKNREALEQKEYVIMALTSNYSIMKQEENNFRLFRSGDITDLTFIEGASSLYRFVIPVRCTDLKVKTKSVETYYDKLAIEENKFSN